MALNQKLRRVGNAFGDFTYGGYLIEKRGTGRLDVRWVAKRDGVAVRASTCLRSLLDLLDY